MSSAQNHLDRLQATLHFNEPVESVSQVSSKRAQHLQALGITKIRDLLEHFPRRYIDMSSVVKIEDMRIGAYCTVLVRIYEITTKKIRNLSIVEFTLVDETGAFIATFFNQPWLAQSYHANDVVTISGKVEFEYGFLRMKSPLMEPLEQGDQPQGKVLAFYPATKALSQVLLRRLTNNALEEIKGLYDVVPLYLRSRYRLCSRYHALHMIHRPRSLEEVTQAQRRLRYEELLFLELYLIEENKKERENKTPYIQPLTAQLKEKIQSVLSFDLRQDQLIAIDEISHAMGDARLMRHLLLGDVGTGKTVVALFGIAAACAAGNQAVMIGPTEVLVWQYASSLGALLDELGISWEILTSSTSVAKKHDILHRLSEGLLQVVFGTHSLIEDAVRFKNCSFVCIDEQQRFGVNQRKALLEKAPCADVLSMTATPIPRSYALMLYGDISLSYLGKGVSKHKRTTKVCHFSEEGIAYDALRHAIEKGEQAYVICPLIGFDPKEEDTQDSSVMYAEVEYQLSHDNLPDNLHAAKAHAQFLKNQVVPQARVELLHGKMSSHDKAKVMALFRAGEIDVLVSTTVIEVGVDVANATVMIIEDADRFGLAQLHQLRGRVGRGDKKGQVFLVSRSKSPHALERLAAMESTEDGFELSEYDLRQRKEGDIFGVQQHGKSALKLVNVIRDKAIVEAARNDAYALVYRQEGTDEEYALLMRELNARKESSQCE